MFFLQQILLYLRRILVSRSFLQTILMAMNKRSIIDSFLSNLASRKAGQGAQWVQEAARPWDPPLAPNGRQQAQSAAKRMKQAQDEFVWAFFEQILEQSTAIRGCNVLPFLYFLS